jgi:hypothetical protein
MLQKLYLLTSAGIVGVWLVAALGGSEWGNPPREEIPASVRSAPGGYRSFHFWHAGYHGGK